MKLIERNRADTDERKVMVNLTEKGGKLKEKAMLIPYKIAHTFDDDTIYESEIV